MAEKSKQQLLIEHGNSKQGAEVYYRKDWECYYFSLVGKCFGMMNNELITVKGKPQENEILRETYQDVIPGYYANKTHWNSIYLRTEELSIQELESLIDCSYELVYQNLTKKNQKLVNELK